MVGEDGRSMSGHVSFKALVSLAALGAGLISPALTQAGGGPDLPAYAKPGQCYGRVTTPALYSTTTVQELVRSGRKTTRLVRPAVVQKTVTRVLVRPARTVQVRGPGVYRVTTRTVVVPGRRYWKVEPATYRTEQEKVLVEAAHAEWRPTSQPLAYGERLPGQTMLQATGEVYCRVLVPARYEYRSRQVEVSPERRTEIAEPARKKIIRTRVLIKAGPLVTRTLPAVYREQVTRKVIRPAAYEVVGGPAVYRSVEKKVVVREEGQGWAQVFCGGAISNEFLYKVQGALAAKGYDPGPVDGIDKPSMYAALSRFQRDRHIARGQLTIETGRALGVY
jgi:hypothetical protein